MKTGEVAIVLGSFLWMVSLIFLEQCYPFLESCMDIQHPFWLAVLRCPSIGAINFLSGFIVMCYLFYYAVLQQRRGERGSEKQKPSEEQEWAQKDDYRDEDGETE